MRELKFRVWDKQQKKFHTDADWGISLRGSCIIGFSSHDSWDHDKGYKINLGNQNNLVVQQYTGLKDKNGKEIYEGDILMPDTIDGIWPEQRNGVLVKDIRQPFANAHLFKIIGNIFENPELLKTNE